MHSHDEDALQPFKRIQQAFLRDLQAISVGKRAFIRGASCHGLPLVSTGHLLVTIKGVIFIPGATGDRNARQMCRLGR